MPAPEENPGLSEETVSVIEGEVKKGKVRKFFLIARGATIQTVGVFKKGQFGTRITEAKKNGFKGDVSYGVVTGSGKNLTFQFAGTPEVAEVMGVDGFIDAVPVKEVKLREFFSDNDLDVKVECQCISNVAQALVPIVDEETAAPAQATTPQPPPGPSAPTSDVEPGSDDATAQRKAKLEEALRALVPKIKQAAADFPDRKAEILGPVAAIKQQLEANQLDAAKQSISTVVQLLKQLGEATPATTTPEPVARGPVPPQYTQLLGAVQPNYVRAIDEKLGDYEKFKKLMLFAEEKAEAGDYASAQRALEGLTKALDAALVAPTSSDPGVTLFAIGKARLEFEQLHSQAILASEQVRDEIMVEFKDDEEQVFELQRAIDILNSKIDDLRIDLNKQLDEVVNAAPTDRVKFAQAVRRQVDLYLDFLVTDEVMSNLDGNEFLPGTYVIEPLKGKLDEIASLLEKVTA